MRREVFKFLDQYGFLGKVVPTSDFPAALVEALRAQVSQCHARLQVTVEESAGVDVAMDGWVDVSILLSALAALLSHESGEYLLGKDYIQECLPDVIHVLGLAHKHIPTMKTGRQSAGSHLAVPNIKRDCISIIANITHGSKEMQDTVREQDGLPLIMAQCNIDDLNPYLREHAMYCLRNLLDGNPENQRVVDSIKPVGIQESAELSDLGYRAELKDGKPIVSRVAKIESINDD